MAFNLPVQNFFTRTVEPTPWVRPADWPIITDAANEVQFLFSDINDASCTVRTQFTRTSGSQNIIIDWGDGNTDTITGASQTDTVHQYVVGSGTPCSRGYTTFKIRVYFTGTGVSILNACRIFSALLPGNTGNPYDEIGLLEIYYGDGTQTVSPANYYQSSSANQPSSFVYLEYVKLPSVVTFNSLSSTFDGCSSLAEIKMPTSASSLTTIGSMCNNCYSLYTITIPSNAILISTFASSFYQCYNLTSINLPNSLNVLTSFSSAFQFCNSLKNITIPSINICTNFQNTFANCFSLEWVKFTSLPTFGTPTSVIASALFQNCYNLQNVYFPTTCSANANYTFNTAFSTCTSLRTLVLPSGFNPNTLVSAFQNCYNLKRVTFQSGASNLIDISQAFGGCFSITSITLPTSASASGISLVNAFANCYALKSLTIPNTYLITSLTGTFFNCYSLKTLNWTPGAQNLLTSLQTTFQNCSLLESVSLPTSMNALTNLSTTFSNCKSLLSVTFPTSLNAVTTMSTAFTNCTKLVSVNLPTSMSSCTAMNSMFSGCSVIRTVTLPNVVSSSFANFASAFNGCSSLETITFPGSAQLSSVTGIQAIFNACGNLKTINNFDKVGSLTATPLVTASNNNYLNIPSISFVMPLSNLAVSNVNATQRNGITSLRLLNTSAGQWTGTSPQINVGATSLSTSALVQLFNDIAAQGNVVSKTINISNALGAAGLTAADRLIITSKGWTITG